MSALPHAVLNAPPRAARGPAPPLRAGVLAGVLGAHAAALALLADPAVTPVTAAQPLPVVAVQLVAPPAPPVPPEPASAPPIPPPPEPVAEVQPTAPPVIQPRAVVKPRPQRRAPVRPARQEPAPVSAQPPAPAQPPTQVASTAPVPAAPPVVIPPRFDAAYLRNPAPEYPYAALRRRQEGQVLLRVEVSPDGRARQVGLERTSGSRALDHAAMEAVTNWSFVPARRGDEAVVAWVLVPVSFRLTR